MPVKLRTCVHCNTTFTSAVSLSNHLRAYVRKKSAGVLTGTGMFEQITQQVCLINELFFSQQTGANLDDIYGFLCYAAVEFEYVLIFGNL